MERGGGRGGKESGQKFAKTRKQYFVTHSTLAQDNKKGSIFGIPCRIPYHLGAAERRDFRVWFVMAVEAVAAKAKQPFHKEKEEEEDLLWFPPSLPPSARHHLFSFLRPSFEIPPSSPFLPTACPERERIRERRRNIIEA